jgi:mycofactocin precursor
MDTLGCMEPTTTSAEQTVEGASGSGAQEPTIVTELLVEEISIDGMCGVY